MDPSEATPRTRAALTRQQQQVIRLNKTRPERSINRQDVLTEEEYVEALEKIIARDFFPLVSERLKERELEQEILSGFHSQDPDVIERSVRHMQNLATHDPQWSTRINNRRNVADTPRFSAATPAGRSVYGETPVAASSNGDARLATRYDADLSLDSFQSKYTSEDNASFAQIIDEENVNRRSRYAWAYQAESEASGKSRRAIEARQQLVDLSRRLAEGDTEVRLIEGSEPGRPGQRLLIEGRTSLAGDRASLEYAKRRLIAAPAREHLLIEGGEQAGIAKASAPEASTSQLETSTSSRTEREAELALSLKENKEEIDKSRQESEIGTGVTAWPFTARNNFYYPPDANVAVQDTGKRSLEARRSKEAVDTLGVTEPKGIRYGMTRLFNDEDLNEEARKAGVPPSPSHSNIAAAISGTPYPGRDSFTPRVQGYSFVDAMPSPTPSELGTQGVNALMTFGTIASTPVALRDSNEDDPVFKAPAPPSHVEGDEPAHFRINKSGRREQLAHRMATKAGRSLSKKHNSTSGSTGLGLLRFGDRSLSATPGTFSSATVTSVKKAEGTPGRDAFLSPAARTLLGKAKGGRQQVGSSPYEGGRTRKGQDDRDKESHERLKRQRWDPSPLGAGATHSRG